jgi:hypothetical protein
MHQILHYILVLADCSAPVRSAFSCKKFGKKYQKEMLRIFFGGYRNFVTLVVALATLRYSTLLYATLRYSTLLYATLRYSTLLYATLRYSTLPTRLDQFIAKLSYFVIVIIAPVCL